MIIDTVQLHNLERQMHHDALLQNLGFAKLSIAYKKSDIALGYRTLYEGKRASTVISK